MKFQLQENKVDSLHIDKVDGEAESKNTFNFEYRCLFDDSVNDEFVILFDFFLQSKNKFTLNLEHRFIFKSDEPLTPDFLNSHYTSINAPAIAYPFLRAFVATLLLNAGLESVSLPAINFVEHLKQRSKDDSAQPK